MKPIKSLVVLACLLGYSALLQAQTCSAIVPASTPTTDFTVNPDGTVTHLPTGLMWQQCALGLSGPTCSTGSAASMIWSAALTAAVADRTVGYSDWRLPNLKELRSIVEEKCYSPSINANVFPNTPASFFWSASALVGASDGAWGVGFSYGDAYSGVYVNGVGRVRLVRAGQSFGSFDSYDTVPLTVTKSGAGSVNGGPINCGSTCSGNAGRGFGVTLTASPAANLSAWGGACASAGAAPTCTLTMDAGKTVSASFLEAPIVSATPSALSFAAQNVGSTSAAHSVTLSNTGTTAMSSVVIAASGDFSLASNLCGTSLAANASCTFGVRFSPAAAGARSGAISISSNAPGSPQSVVALSGTGQGGVLSLSPGSLYFPSRYTGTSSTPQSITLSNVGGTAVNFSSIVANGEFSRSTTCLASLAPGANCSVGVIFSPLTVGYQVSSLVITSDGTGSPQTVSLSGTGLAVPGVALSPGSLTFANQRQGSPSAAQSISLLNSGTATLALNSVGASGDFGVTHNCGTGPAAGASCTLSVTFTPTALGTRTGSVSISSNAIGSPHTVGLSGVGISANTPLCSLSAAPARIQPGRSTTLTASCTPTTVTYTWTGGACAASTGPSCTDTPLVTTVYGVTGSNSDGSSAASATVTVRSADLTPILMLLLDD